MSMPDEELFSIQDFKSIEVRVWVENLTTKTGVHDDSRMLGSVEIPLEGEHPEARLMEFDAKTISLDLPHRTAASGHFLDLKIDVTGIQLPFCFEVRGKVSLTEALDDGRERVVVEMTEYEPRYFDALKNIFIQRQVEIDAFLKQVRG
jgi:hypothetical protein